MQRVDITRVTGSSQRRETNKQRPSRAVSPKPVGLFCPLHYEPNYAYPLLVWINASHAGGEKIQHALPQISMRNYVGAAPICPSNRLPEPTSVLAAVDRAQSQYSIHPQRIFIAGIGDGGALALKMALQNPGVFAAAASLGGPFPEFENRLANLKSARQIPFLICQGSQSTRYSNDQTCENLRLFHVAGLQVTLRQYHCGDEFHPPMMADLNRWLMEQVNS